MEGVAGKPFRGPGGPRSSGWDGGSLQVGSRLRDGQEEPITAGVQNQAVFSCKVWLLCTYQGHSGFWQPWGGGVGQGRQ